MDTLISVVVPMYNEEGNIPELHAQLSVALGSMGEGYELVFVDDGSTDNTANMLKELRTKDARVKVVRLSKNFGQHPALTAGFNAAKGEIIVTLDADLQNPPAEIPKMVEKIKAGYDVVACIRRDRQDSLLRKLASVMVNKLIAKATGVTLKDYGCSLRAYKRWVIDELNRCGEMSKFIPAYISWVGVNIIEVEVAHNPRKAGKSRYNFLKLARMSYDLVTGYSRLPIMLVGFAGMFMFAAGMLWGVALAVLGAGGISGALQAALAGMTVCTGLILGGLAVVGEYAGRALIEVQKRPYYIVKEELL